MRKSSIVYRERSRVAVLHEDLLEICDGNMLAAMLLSILIYWTDVKLAGYEQECEQAKAIGEPMPTANLWIWKSHEGFQHDLMNDKDGMRKVHRSTIASALKVLVDKKFTAMRRNPHNNIDQTRQYRVERQTVQAAIHALPPLFDSTKTDNRMSEISQSNVGNHAMDCTKTDNALPKNRQAIPKITGIDDDHEITDKDDESTAQSANAIAPHAPATQNDEEDDGRDDTGHDAQDATRNRDSAAQPLRAGGSAEVAHAGNSAAKRTRKPKAEKVTPSGPPIEPDTSATWGTRKCLAWFDYWRGSRLIGTYKNSQAATCAKGLAEQYSEEIVLSIREDMENDPYYIGRGGCDVCDVANNITKYLRLREARKRGVITSTQQPSKTKPTRVISSFDDPDYECEDEFYPSEYERQQQFAREREAMKEVAHV